MTKARRASQSSLAIFIRLAVLCVYSSESLVALSSSNAVESPQVAVAQRQPPKIIQSLSTSGKNLSSQTEQVERPPVATDHDGHMNWLTLHQNDTIDVDSINSIEALNTLYKRLEKERFFKHLIINSKLRVRVDLSLSQWLVKLVQKLNATTLKLSMRKYSKKQVSFNTTVKIFELSEHFSDPNHVTANITVNKPIHHITHKHCFKNPTQHHVAGCYKWLISKKNLQQTVNRAQSVKQTNLNTTNSSGLLEQLNDEIYNATGQINDTMTHELTTNHSRSLESRPKQYELIIDSVLFSLKKPGNYVICIRFLNGNFSIYTENMCYDWAVKPDYHKAVGDVVHHPTYQDDHDHEESHSFHYKPLFLVLMYILCASILIPISIWNHFKETRKEHHALKKSMTEGSLNNQPSETEPLFQTKSDSCLSQHGQLPPLPPSAQTLSVPSGADEKRGSSSSLKAMFLRKRNKDGSLAAVSEASTQDPPSPAVKEAPFNFSNSVDKPSISKMSQESFQKLGKSPSLMNAAANNNANNGAGNKKVFFDVHSDDENQDLVSLEESTLSKPFDLESRRETIESFKKFSQYLKKSSSSSSSSSEKVDVNPEADHILDDKPWLKNSDPLLASNFVTSLSFYDMNKLDPDQHQPMLSRMSSASRQLMQSGEIEVAKLDDDEVNLPAKNLNKSASSEDVKRPKPAQTVERAKPAVASSLSKETPQAPSERVTNIAEGGQASARFAGANRQASESATGLNKMQTSTSFNKLAKTDAKNSESQRSLVKGIGITYYETNV